MLQHPYSKTFYIKHFSHLQEEGIIEYIQDELNSMFITGISETVGDRKWGNICSVMSLV